MAIDVRLIHNANVYINGINHFGEAAEFEMPIIKYKGLEYTALGLIGTVNFFGGIEAMEAKVKWKSFYEGVLELAANPFMSVMLQARANMEKHSGKGLEEEVPVVITTEGKFKDVPLGAFKPGENVELETNMDVTYCKLEIDGIAIIEVDIINSIFKQGDKDLLENYRKNIGI